MTHRFSSARRALLAGAATAPLLPGTLAGTAAARTPGDRDDDADSPAALAVAWHLITESALAAAAFPEPITQSRTWAVSWLAAARATRGQRGTFAAAAFVQALHDVLVATVPAQRAVLDTALTSALDTLTPGRARTQGSAAGAAAATAVLAERAGDGTDTASVNTPFTPQAAAPGVWQLTPPATRPAVRAGQAAARPFLLTGADQFDPGPPPALDSATYLADLAETARLGRADGPRTPAQTAVARFWYPGITGFTAQVTRQLLAALPAASLAEASRLVAAVHVTSVDAQIQLAATKYRYLFWRPVTAITTGSVRQEPTWTSLEVAPQHPEYPSGHTLQAGAQQAVLEALVGRRSPVPVVLTSSNLPGRARLYRDWGRLTDDVVDARVLEGVHFRNSDLVGAQLGRRVARYGLARLDSIGL